MIPMLRYTLKTPTQKHPQHLHTFVHFIAECADKAIARGSRHFDEVVEPVNSGELIIDVFVKGAVGIFDSNNKKEFVSNICIDLNVPFVPDNLKRWVRCSRLRTQLQPSLSQACFCWCVRHAVARL